MANYSINLNSIQNPGFRRHIAPRYLIPFLLRFNHSLIHLFTQAQLYSRQPSLPPFPHPSSLSLSYLSHNPNLYQPSPPLVTYVSAITNTSPLSPLPTHYHHHSSSSSSSALICASSPPREPLTASKSNSLELPPLRCSPTPEPKDKNRDKEQRARSVPVPVTVAVHNHARDPCPCDENRNITYIPASSSLGFYRPPPPVERGDVTYVPASSSLGFHGSPPKEKFEGWNCMWTGRMCIWVWTVVGTGVREQYRGCGFEGG